MDRPKPFTYILLFISAHFFHHLLTALVVPLLPFIRDGFGLTYAQAGLVVSAFTLAYGIGQLPAGWLADRIGPKFVLTVGIAGVGLAGAAVGLSIGYGALIGFLVLMGIAGGGYHPAAAPLISAAVPAPQRGKALGLHLIGGSSSHFVSPLVGVAIAGLIGWRGAFVAISLPVFVFGVALFWILTHDEIRARAGTRRAPTGSADAAAEVPTRPSVITVFLVMTATVGAFTGSVIAFIPLYLVDVFGASEQAAAVFLSAFYTTGLWASPLGGSISDRFGPLTVFVILAIAIGPLIMLLGGAPHWMAVALVMLGVGVTLFVRMPVSEAYLVTAVRKKNQSTVLGIYFFAGMEGSGILTPILGHAIDVYGFRTGFAGVGAVLTVIIAAGCIALVVLKRTRTAGSLLA
ncbi:MAG: MFS transporter [Spirochaetaceae bacterium]|nr:MAG: MFS transporter [Spirochaetaceae bacterium]